MTLGEKISDLRKRKGISQEKLAELLDISRQAVTKWESGKGNPDTENLIRLSEIFGVSLDELCGKEAEKPKKINYAPGHILCLLFPCLHLCFQMSASQPVYRAGNLYRRFLRSSRV